MKFTMTVEDTPEDTVSFDFKFDPPISESSEESNAAHVAAKTMKFINELCEEHSSEVISDVVE